MMKYIKSPLNYIGGKHKILPQLFTAFPKKVDTFVDLFAGGFNVGINVNAERIICNDQITYLIDLYRYLAETDIRDVRAAIKKRIDEFQLTKQNAEGYYALRDRYNMSEDIVDFLVLTFYSFNHQIRFNNSRKFNTSFGKDRSSYNPQIEKNLICFCDALHSKNIDLLNLDFLDVNLSRLGDRDLVYCDPPYLISNGSYNDGKRGFKNWTSVEDHQLFNLLDSLHEQGTRFALSNVLYHKGMSNDALIEWSRKYKVCYIDTTYANCSYHFKERNAKTVEVVITNFEN